MSIVDHRSVDYVGAGVRGEGSFSTSNRVLHRLAAVRRLQHLSRRALARRMHVETTDIRRQEEAHDLPLRVLYAWQKALDVPLAELLVRAGRLAFPAA